MRLINGEALEEMKKMEDESVDLIITSPPYDNLRTYNGNLNWNFEIFKPIAKESARILKEGGVIVWIVGDATMKFNETGTSFRQALHFKDECGLNLLDTMIYYKQNYAPAYPTLRRYANQFEYMFVFSKGRPNTFNPIQVRKIEDRKGMVGFRKKNGDVVRKYVESTRKTKDASNVWSIPVGFKNLGHPAVFPEKLAEDHILTWSNEGDVVLDIFMGSGTTGKMALKNKRDFIGIEIDEEYFKIAEKRINEQ